MIDINISNKLRNMALVCACFVVFIHSDVIAPVGSVAWWTRQVLGGGICRVAVPFFFFASGFFLALHMDEHGWFMREMRKRVMTLLVPYVVFCCIGIFYKTLTQQEIFDLSSLVKGFGFVWNYQPATGVLWYVRTLMIFVLISPLLKMVAERKFLFSFVLVVCCVYNFVVNNQNSLEGSYFLYSYFSYFGPIYFLIGIYAGRKKIVLTLSGKEVCQALILGVSLLAAYCWNMLGNDLFRARVFLCASIPFLLAGMWGVMPSAKWPVMLTSFSFPIFLLQAYAKAPVLWVINRNSTVYDIFHKTTVGHLGVALGVCIVACIMATCMKRIFPRISIFFFGGR